MSRTTFRAVVSATQASHRRDQEPIAPQHGTQRATEPVELTAAEYRAMTKRAPRNHAEQDMHEALIAWRDVHVGQYPVLARLAHWPAGEYRTPKAAAQIKRLGGAAGLPDLFLFVPGAVSAALCIELKCGKNTLSDAQSQWREWLEEADFDYNIIYDDWTIAARLICAWCGLPEELVP